MQIKSVAIAVSALCGAVPLPAQRADTVVKTAGRPVHAGVASLVQEVSIGVESGTDEYMLGRVADLTVARDGSIYVVDKSVPIIRAYDATGKFVRSIGRKGQGPGEYSSIAGINLLPDGRLVAWDLGGARINVYSTAGAALDHWPAGAYATSDVGGHDFLTVDTAGNIYLRKEAFELRRVTDASGGTSQRPDMTRSRQIWVRRATSGALDSLDAPSRPANGQRVMRAVNATGNSSVSRGIPYDPHYLLARSPFGYFVSGFNNRYAFELNYPDSRIVSIRRDVRAEPVTSAERAAARSMVNAQMRRVDPSWSWNGPEIPETKPLYTMLNVGTDGRIWVNVTPPRYETPAPGAPSPVMGRGGARGGGTGGLPSCSTAHPSAHDVFEPDGTYIGRVQLPGGLDVYVRRGDHVWGSICGDDDVPTVRRYKIAWR